MEQEFKRNYLRLLKYANTEAGRFLLGIKDKRQVIKLSSNSYHLLNGDKSITAVIYARNKISSIFLPVLTKIELALESKYARRIIENPYEAFLHYSYLEAKNYKYPQVYLTTTNFSSNSGGDGGLIKNDNTDWATTRNAATAQATDSGVGGGYQTGNYHITRGFFPYDTSSIGAGATISAALLETIAGAKVDTDNDAQSYLVVVASTQADNTSLALGDFDQLGTTAFSQNFDMTDIVADGATYNTFTLNASGRANISPTGWSPFGMREGHDMENVDPGTTGLTYCQLGYGADNRLAVTYTPISTATNQAQVFFM